MIITKKKLSRRTVLRGLGASLSLPLLDSMMPALSAQEENPTKRLGVVYVPNGMAMKRWTPEADGADFEITRIMKPMEAYRNRMLVITGLDGPTSNAGVHASASTRFLTGAIPRRAESDLRAAHSRRSHAHDRGSACDRRCEASRSSDSSFVTRHSCTVGRRPVPGGGRIRPN